MWVLVSFISFIVFWLGFVGRLAKGPTALRQAFFCAAALWGVVVFILSELLSFLQVLSFIPLLIAWCVVLALALYYFRNYWPKLSLGFVKGIFCEWTMTDKIFLAVLVAIASIKCFSAIFSAPNTYDSMTYHLPRVEHWIQNKTLDHYPTSVLRQLYSAPWAEYAILHLRILSGADYFSNAVQWFSSLGSWVGVSALAQLLGANRRGQLLAAVLAASLPMGLVQATSTQTDYVLTFWMVAFVYLLWLTYQQPRKRQILAAGVVLGLALLTKGNAYLYSPIWILIYFIAALRNLDYQRLKSLGMIIAIAFVFIIPYSLRNTVVFGKPTWTHEVLVNQEPTFKTIAANIVCNTALHWGTPWVGVNQKIKDVLKLIAQGVGFDLQRPDPKPRADEFYFQALSTGEDDAGNLLYFCLFVLTLLTMFLHPGLRQKNYWLYALAIVVMVIMFCVAVRYHPFNSRYHLAIFVISTALTASVLTQILHRWVLIIGILVGALAWPWLMTCNEHPLLGSRSILKTSRTEQYFSVRPDLILPYTLTMHVLEASECRDIGLMQGENDWEYPWWVFLRQKYGEKFRLEHVGMENKTSAAQYPKGVFVPCILITRDPRTVLSLPQGIYVRVWFIDLPQGLTSVFLHKS